MRSVAIIPARGGSKRIPRKNIALFRGKPMISYAIAAARASGVFDAIVVSTDDDEIAEVAIANGAEVPFRRPAFLANDHATTLPVIQHAVQQLAGGNADLAFACCIYPCVPFLRGVDLQEAYSRVASSGVGFVYPVIRFANSPVRSMRRASDGRMSFLFPEHELTRSQDLEPCYFDAGQYYFGTVRAWLSAERLHSSGIGIEVQEDRFVDIDTPRDWQTAESLADRALT